MNLDKYGIKNSLVNHQLSVDELQKIIVSNKQGQIVNSGALAINTGKFTGRSPKDRYIVRDTITDKLVWWGNINIEFNNTSFDSLYKKLTDYLSNKDLYVRDSYVCSLDDYRVNVRTICELPSSDFFTNNMFLRIKKDQISSFKEDWLLINAPNFLANPKIDKTRSENFSIINFSAKVIIIGGTGYTGEIKKAIFSILNFMLPIYKNVLPMHCSSNVGVDEDTSIFFGLSGTGKTTLSADPKRMLIGDDEHGWSDDGIFNFEGGCYAKTINLSKKAEPQIWNAIKDGAVLENVVLNPKTMNPDYDDDSLTENTRVVYPLNYIPGAVIPSVAGHPKSIIFLTADAFGVLPPISKLTNAQVQYYFISGYTAKVRLQTGMFVGSGGEV